MWRLWARNQSAAFGDADDYCLAHRWLLLLVLGVVLADDVRNCDDGRKMAAWKKKKPLQAAAFLALCVAKTSKGSAVAHWLNFN
jgi:hypothetical protein